MSKVQVLLNEQHTLLPDQERVLNEKFQEGWITRPIPQHGWTLDEQKRIADEYEGSDVSSLVFASPVPVLLGLLASKSGYSELADRHNTGRVIQTPAVYIFHNDRREKKGATEWENYP